MSDISGNPVYDTALAYQRTAALIAAVKLDIFTLIGEGDMTSQVLAQLAGTSPRGMRILCDYLTVIGFLKKQDEKYSQTFVARRFLDRSSPTSIGSCLDFLAAPEMVALTLEDPVSYIRNGGSPGLATIAPDHPIWSRFARAMTPFAYQTAKRVAVFVRSLPEKPKRILDIAAGHGLYGIELLRVNPEAAVTAVDWTDVLSLAKMNAEEAGVADRHHLMPGNASELDWGSGFDLVLLPNFLHHFGRKECTSLLRKARACITAQGYVLVIEFVPNSDRISPPLPAAFAFSMLAQTPNGDAYTVEDLESMGIEAGYSRVTVHPFSDPADAVDVQIVDAANSMNFERASGADI